MQHEAIENWEHKVDELLAQEDEVLAGLKKAVDENYLEAEEAEERIRAYHHGHNPLIVPDVAGRDL